MDTSDTANDKKNVATNGKGPGSRPVGAFGVTVWLTFYVLLTLALFYALLVLGLAPAPEDESQAAAAAPAEATAAEPAVATPAAVTGQARPTEKPAAAPAPTPLCVELRWPFCGELTHDRRMILLVLIGGALGSLLHVIRSFGWYVGNRRLLRSWLAYYSAMPFTGSILGLVFYVVVRAGFITPNGEASESPFGFVAVAMLVGLFSQQAVLKLKSVADLVFTEPGKGSDPAPQDEGTPTPTPTPPAAFAIEKVFIDEARKPPSLVITGRGFADGSAVKIDGTARSPVSFGSATELSVPLDPADTSARASTHEVVVTKDGASTTSSTTFDAPKPTSD